MSTPAESKSEALQTLSGPEFCPRRQFMKGIACAGAALAAPSILAGPALTESQTENPASGGIPSATDKWGPFTPSSRAGHYLHLSYPPSTDEGELQIGAAYTLWIPDKLQTVRAVIIDQHGASVPAAQAGATSAYDLHWQALAKKWDCALLGPSYHVLNDALDLTPGGAELWFDRLRFGTIEPIPGRATRLLDQLTTLHKRIA
jgi:hypothetical protein